MRKICLLSANRDLKQDDLSGQDAALVKAQNKI